MTLTFYPGADEVAYGTLEEKVDALLKGAEAFRVIVKDVGVRAEPKEDDVGRGMVPRDLTASYNWQEIARVLHEVRELPEIDKADKHRKSDLLTKLSETYEVLRAAKMPKLEAVRLSLISEAKQLKSDATQVS